MLHKPLDERVTLEFRQLPLQQAVDRLLRGQNYALHYLQPLRSGVNQGERLRGTLWVFSDDAHRTDATTDATDVRPAAVSDPTDSRDDQLPLVVAAALGDWEASVREEAVDVLGELSGETAIPLLEQALLDPDSDVQEAAIAALADIGGDQAAWALATALNDDNARAHRSMRPAQFSECEVNRTEAAESALQHQGADHPGYQQPIWIDKIAEERTQQYQSPGDAVMQTCIITHDCLPL